MKKVLLPEKIIEEGIALLTGKVNTVNSRDASEEAILEEVGDAFGIVLRSGARITRRIIEAGKNLKIISRTGAGYDNVDVQAATEHGIMVCNLPGINSIPVAEHTIALLLALFKKLPEMDEAVRKDQWKKRSLYLPREVNGKTVGIIGLGKIGRIVMNYCKCLGMSVIAYDPYFKNSLENDYLMSSNMEDVFKYADVVTVHVPNLPETHGMITEKLLCSMKPGSFFINTSRGEVVDEQALIKVLEEGILAGAGIDVFEKEPVVQDNPLLKFKNVILSPHSAALTNECGIKMTVEAVRQVLDLVEGRIPPYIVNKKELNL